MRVLIFVLLLWASPAVAYTQLSRVWIVEFASTRVEAAGPLAKLPALVHQKPLDISTAQAMSANFNKGTRFVRVMCEVPCLIQIGPNPLASALALPSMRPEYFVVDPGSFLSVSAIP